MVKERIIGALAATEAVIDQSPVAGRELSLVRTKLDEALMWAERAQRVIDDIGDAEALR